MYRLEDVLQLNDADNGIVGSQLNCHCSTVSLSHGSRRHVTVRLYDTSRKFWPSLPVKTLTF